MASSSPKSILGFALYLEFRRETYANQHLFIPAIPDRLHESVIEPKYISRQISQVNPNRPWKYRPIDLPMLSYDSTTHMLSAVRDIDQAYKVTQPFIDVVVHNINNMLTCGWKAYKQPLVLGLTETDGIAIRTHATPSALMRRLEHAREEAGFDRHVYPEVV